MTFSSNTRKILSWITGVSVACTVAMCLLVYRLRGDTACWYGSLLLALATPPLLVSRNLNLRGLEPCVCSSLLAMVMERAFFQYQMLWIPCTMLLVIAAGLLLYFVTARGTRSLDPLRKNSGSVRVSNRTLLLCGSYGAILTLFGVIGLLFDGVCRAAPCICLGVALVLFAFTVYYFPWHIRFSETSYTVCSLRGCRQYSYASITAIRQLPLAGYLVYGKTGRLTCHLRLSMEHAALLWPYLCNGSPAQKAC